MKKMDDDQLMSMHERAERDFFNYVRSNTDKSNKTNTMKEEINE